jgi:hypothetical protein
MANMKVAWISARVEFIGAEDLYDTGEEDQ